MRRTQWEGSGGRGPRAEGEKGMTVGSSEILPARSVNCDEPTPATTCERNQSAFSGRKELTVPKGAVCVGRASKTLSLTEVGGRAGERAGKRAGKQAGRQAGRVLHVDPEERGEFRISQLGN